ncbi:MAG: DNA-directed RNA polymerase subunit N [Bradyrhizobium sp.]
MKKAIAAIVLGVSLMSAPAMAAERTTDAALGAVSGAVVLGPIGAVAGALVGYTAGPSIAHAWSPRRSRAVRRRARARRPVMRTSASDPQPAREQTSKPAVKAASTPPAPAARASAMPPVQPLD